MAGYPIRVSDGGPNAYLGMSKRDADRLRTEGNRLKFSDNRTPLIET